MEQWYVAQTKPLHERRAAERCTEQDFAWWLPELNGRPLLPGYLFVEPRTCNFGEFRHAIHNSPGILHLLPSREMPLPVRAEQMLVLREIERAAQEAVVVQIEELYVAGETVRVLSGACSGLRGIVQLTQKRMLLVLISGFGRLNVPADLVERVDGDTPEAPELRRPKQRVRGQGGRHKLALRAVAIS